MRRASILAALGLAVASLGRSASAQVVISPRVAPSHSHSRARDQLARREFQRQGLRAAALRQGITPWQLMTLDRLLDEERLQDGQFNDTFSFGPSLPPVIFLPPTTGSTDPFAGSPNDGNYYYWLSRQYAQGRVSKAEYNRQVYGIGRK